MSTKLASDDIYSEVKNRKGRGRGVLDGVPETLIRIQKGTENK